MIRSVALLPLLLACACQPRAPQPAGPPAAPVQPTIQQPNLLVLLPDSLRADRIEAQRDGRAVAPHMAALAAEGVLFEQAISQAGWTMPALATALSGRYPVLPSADATMLGWIGHEHRSFPEILAMYGYQTHGFLGDRAQVLDQAFGAVASSSGDDPSAWLASAPPEPWLALVHETDLQFVASTEALQDDPDAQQRCRQLAGERSDRSVLAIGELARCLDPGGRDKTQVARIHAAYDRVVTGWDQQLGAMLAALEASGQAPRTVVILSSPHGHHLGENGRFVHGTLHQPDLHIPLIWRDPELPAPGQRSAETVQLMDLAPSILARAGATPDQGMQGQSLLPLLGLADGSYEEREVYSLNDRRNMALRSGDLSMIRFERGGPRGPQREPGWLLFDLEADPGERHELMGSSPPPQAKAMRERLAAFNAARIAESQRALPAASPQPDQALKEHLQDHGYWHHVAPDGQPAPPQE
jgi:arylsulfatase A-like enzyme